MLSYVFITFTSYESLDIKDMYYSFFLPAVFHNMTTNQII